MLPPGEVQRVLGDPNGANPRRPRRAPNARRAGGFFRPVPRRLRGVDELAGALIRVGHLEESERHLVIPVPADSERIRDNVRERLLSDADGERLDRASAPVRRLRVREVALRILREEHAIFSASALTELVNQVSDEVVGIGPIERLLRDPEVSEGILTYGSVGEVSVACFRERLVRRINMRTL